MYDIPAKSRAPLPDRKSALAGAALILGFGTAAALLLNGFAWVAGKIDDAIAALLRTRDDVVSEIAATEARLAELQAELSRIDADRETLAAAAAELET